MNECALVATYHKTGTVWMASTFRHICAALNIRFAQPVKEGGFADLSPPVVVFDGHSFTRRELRWIPAAGRHRMLHLIRDPRDILISAMHYHRKSEETWLHMPRAKFGAMTYQERINSLPSDRERYIFEMDNSTGSTVRNMVSWDYTQQDCFECKYEDLVVDVEMELFTRVVSHLGFSGAEIEECRKQFWQTSVFGGNNGKRSEHIRSGAARQWPDIFDRHLGEAFVSRFGDALVKLGYEPDNSWVENLPAVTPKAESAQRSAVDASPAG